MKLLNLWLTYFFFFLHQFSPLKFAFNSFIPLSVSEKAPNRTLSQTITLSMFYRNFLWPIKWLLAMFYSPGLTLSPQQELLNKHLEHILREILKICPEHRILILGTINKHLLTVWVSNYFCDLHMHNLLSMDMCCRLWSWEASYSCCLFLPISWVTVHLSHKPARNLWTRTQACMHACTQTHQHTHTE